MGFQAETHPAVTFCSHRIPCVSMKIKIMDNEFKQSTQVISTVVDIELGIRHNYFQHHQSVYRVDAISCKTPNPYRPHRKQNIRDKLQ